MVTDALRYGLELWREPPVADPPKRVWRDWAIVGVMIPVALLEGLLRPDVIWRPWVIVLALIAVWTTLWRRTHPLAMVALIAVLVSTTDIIALINLGRGGEPVGLYSMALFLILPYALFRWGSGRDAALGMVLLLTLFGLSIFRDSNNLGDIVGGFIVLLLPVEMGGAVRYLTATRDQRIEQARSGEREQLARELHDTVAHHVSAIAIQAQAGQAVAATSPDTAIAALATIEQEASRTLAEMRHMIGALRQDAEADLTPQRGVADIERLAGNGTRPPVEIELTGDVERLPAAIDAALYRLAQESITNAVRHARQASRIAVRLIGDGDVVRLVVNDDGDPVNRSATAGKGFGLVGMRERATLLGGTLEAGPRPDRGWQVTAVLPREGR
ncbi:MAG: sensor histidine kinase [Actinomycetota bacterium]